MQKIAYLKNRHVSTHAKGYGEEELYHEAHRVLLETDQALFLQRLEDDLTAPHWAIVDKDTNIVYSAYEITNLDSLAHFAIDFSARSITQTTKEDLVTTVNLHPVAELTTYQEYKKARLSFYREKLEKAIKKVEKFQNRAKKCIEIIMVLSEDSLPIGSVEPSDGDFKIGDKVRVKNRACGFVRSICKRSGNLLIEQHGRNITTDWFPQKALEKVTPTLVEGEAKLQITSPHG